MFGQGGVSIKQKNGEIKDIRKTIWFDRWWNYHQNGVIHLQKFKGQTIVICNIEFDLYKLEKTRLMKKKPNT